MKKGGGWAARSAFDPGPYEPGGQGHASRAVIPLLAQVSEPGSRCARCEVSPAQPSPSPSKPQQALPAASTSREIALVAICRASTKHGDRRDAASYICISRFRLNSRSIMPKAQWVACSVLGISTTSTSSTPSATSMCNVQAQQTRQW